MISCLAWLVISGLHKKIYLSFMVVGHTRCLVDGCFGLLKRNYRHSNVFTLNQLADVVNKLAAPNFARIGGVCWYSWDEFFDIQFKKIPGINGLPRFVFTAEKPGIVATRCDMNSPINEVNILKCSPGEFFREGLPPLLPNSGLTTERQLYLFKEIRQFVPPEYQEELCHVSRAKYAVTVYLRLIFDFRGFLCMRPCAHI